MYKIFLAIAVAVLSLTLTGCPKDEEKDRNSTTGTTDPKVAAAQAMLQSMCTYFEACDADITNLYASAQDCQQGLAELTPDLSESPYATVAKINACAAAMTAAQSTCSWNFLAEENPPSACLAVTTGTAPAGSDCTTDANSCDPTTYCHHERMAGLNGNPQCDICTPLGGLNAPCYWSGQCQADLTCGPLDTCIAKPALLDFEASCLDDEECKSSICVDGVCANLPDEGDDCLDFDIQCAIPLVCVEGTCTRVNFPAADGSPCLDMDDFWPSDLSCQAGSFCAFDQTEMAYLCRPPFGLTEGPCRKDSMCAGDLICNWNNDLCENYAGIDDACDNDEMCDPAVSVCNGSVCIARIAEGEECNQPSMCAEGLACDYTATPPVCTVLGAIGAECEENWACAEYNCFDGFCASEFTCEMPSS